MVLFINQTVPGTTINLTGLQYAVPATPEGNCCFDPIAVATKPSQQFLSKLAYL
jgi:hypothetical protein